VIDASLGRDLCRLGRVSGPVGAGLAEAAHDWAVGAAYMVSDVGRFALLKIG
jgi:hypothetical protein